MNDLGCVTFDCEKQCFGVNDEGKWHLVPTIPDYSCSCKDSPLCCHIMAVKIANGLIIEPRTLRPHKIDKTMALHATNSKSSGSGSKKKFHTRNTNKKFNKVKQTYK